MRLTSRLLWFFVVTVIFAAAARLYQIQAQSIWFDEGWSAFAAVQPTLAGAINADNTNPPLYYVLLNISTRGFGDSVFGLRYFSLLLSLLALPLSYQLARRLFGARAGAHAAFLVAVSPLMWWAAQEARMYSLLALLTLVAALAWHQLLRAPTRWAWAVLWLSELGLLYGHNTGPVAVGWLNAVTFLVWLSSRNMKRPDWRIWFGGQIAVALLWMPWFLMRFLDIRAANSAVNSPPALGPALLSRMWQAFWAGPWAMVGRETLLVGLSAIALFIVLAVIPWRRPNAFWLVAHLAILLLGLLAGLTLLGNEMHGRYQVMLTPLLLVVVAGGVARVRWGAVRYAIGGFFLVIFLVSIQRAQNPSYAHDEARAIVQYYAEQLEVDDTVLAWSYADRFELAYYWERQGVGAQRITLPEGAPLSQVLPLLPTSGRVALNIWFTQQADFRGMLPCILGNGLATSPEQFTVAGMTNQLYELSALRVPQMRSVDVTFGLGRQPIAHVTAAGTFPASTGSQAICVPLELRLDSSPNVDLKTALVVENALGWEVARADAIFAQSDQRLSSQLAPGESLQAYPLLRLPYGTPPGDYAVFLRVYDEQVSPSGYDVLSAQGTPTGKDYRLGNWRVIAGADWAATNRQSELPHQEHYVLGSRLRLIGRDTNLENPTTVVNGEFLQLSLLWQGTGPLPALTLGAADQSWRVPVPASNPANHDAVTLDWRSVQVPLDAEAGLAELLLPDGTAIGRYLIDVLPALEDAPPVDNMVAAALAGVGVLHGYRLAEESVERGQSLSVTLVWRADTTPDLNYTVFVQLLDAENRLIAQSDALPAAGRRPTTGWRAGEYIEDRHSLQFNAEALPGPATMIVGMYDATTGQRVLVAGDASDFISLPTIVQVR